MFWHLEVQILALGLYKIAPANALLDTLNFFQTPPESHSTMREEAEAEVDGTTYQGNVGQEKDKLLLALRDSPSGQIFFDEILKCEDGSLVTRRQAAIAFSGLLVLEAERKVCATQDEYFGRIVVKLL